MRVERPLHDNGRGAVPGRGEEAVRGDDRLLEALEARSGLVCFVGAGGKKTTFYRLAAAHPGRVGVTATVHIPFFPKSLDAHALIADQDALLPALLVEAKRHDKVIFACPSEKHGRFAGVDPSVVSAAHREAGFDVTFVKADGARSRWIKAPNESEPRIPPDAHTVICVVSALAIGQPLSERIAHRVEHIEMLCGARAGEALGVAHIARLLAGEQGGLRGVGKAQVIPVVNMVDDEERRRLAMQVAEHAFRASERFDRVVLTSMRRDPPVVDVVWR